MAITLIAQSGEPLQSPSRHTSREYRVELTAIELSSGQYGEQLKWTFSVPDKGRNLVAYSTFSASLASKCMRWAGALLNRPVQAGEQVDFEALVGKTAVAVVLRKRKEDGTEYNAVDDLLPLRTATAGEPAEEGDPFE
jgi:hypothetical protein